MDRESGESREGVSKAPLLIPLRSRCSLCENLRIEPWLTLGQKQPASLSSPSRSVDKESGESRERDCLLTDRPEARDLVDFG